MAKIYHDQTTTKHTKVRTVCIHNDVIKWKHFPRHWPFVRGIHRSPVNSPYKGQWRGTLMSSLICALINGYVDNREAGNLIRHQAHYDVINEFVGCTDLACGNRLHNLPLIQDEQLIVNYIHIWIWPCKLVCEIYVSFNSVDRHTTYRHKILYKCTKIVGHACLN